MVDTGKKNFWMNTEVSLSTTKYENIHFYLRVYIYVACLL